MTHHTEISEFYTVEGLGNRILSALEAAGKDLDALTVKDLAPVDAFHIRGRRATEELARWAKIRPDDLVLDVGCGLGGTSRYLAAALGCRAVGVDLTEQFCTVAGMLSARVGLADRTVYRHCDAVALPFVDTHFGVVWTEHVQMNIEDKTAFYGEMKRVLKPGGRFVFHDLFAGAAGELFYPLPWAGDASVNHLMPLEELERLLAELSFARLRWEDKTGVSADFFRAALKHVKTNGWRPRGCIW